MLLATSIGGAVKQARGAAVYKAKCAVPWQRWARHFSRCQKHEVQSFKSPELMTWSDDQIIVFTKNTYNKNGPTDAQMKDLVAYIRQLQK